MEANRLPCDVEEDCTIISPDYNNISDEPKCSKGDRFDSGFYSVGLDSESTEKEFIDTFSSKLSLRKESPLREERKYNAGPLTQLITRDEPITAANIYQHIDEDGDTILHLMVIQGNPEKVWSICSKCPDRKYLDSVNKLHQTPLHLAVLMKQPFICKYLLDFKATVDLRDRNGQTPLHIACDQGLFDCVKVLTKYQDTEFNSFEKENCIQDLEIMNYEGFTCLHLAVIGGHMEIIEYLCKLKANVNAQDGKSGRTALHYAVETRNMDLIKLLYELEANINITTYSGLTPERLAKGRGYDEIHACLKTLGAQIEEEEEIDEDMSDADSSDYDDIKFNGKHLSDLNTDSHNQNYIRTTYCLNH